MQRNNCITFKVAVVGRTAGLRLYSGDRKSKNGGLELYIYEGSTLMLR